MTFHRHTHNVKAIVISYCIATNTDESMALSKVVFLSGSSSLPHTLSMYRSLAAAFQQEGIEAIMVDADQDDATVRQSLESCKPDFIFEINRTRNQSLKAIPVDIPHIAWIQDAWRERRPTESKQLHYCDPLFGGSDLTYTLIQPDYFGFSHHLQQGVWGRLHTGIDPLIHRPGDRDETVADTAAICGYIPPPLHAMESAFVRTALCQSNGLTLRVDQVAEYLLHEAKVSICRHTFPQVHALITARINECLGTHIGVDVLLAALGQSATLQLLDTEIPRITDRMALGHLALKAGMTLSIYGSKEWQYWPTFSPFYRQNLHAAQDLAQVYRQTQFNLHNGSFGMHARVLEGMGCGSAMFVHTGCFDDTEFDIKRHFSPGEHYLPLSIEQGAETLRYWRERRSQLRDIGLRAAEEVRLRHTWRHRAREILSDWMSLTSCQEVVEPTAAG
ncbi:glycosyltransferase [Paludibacterium sp. THUN1379]|uniref:glycosyltransferase family protein n=1 Tax=Paludibacterium sp. THUN1379 TaxID=3112107 RepID=UPI0030D56CE9